MNSTPPGDDYDTPWKDAVTRYFPEFIAFYFPLANAQIDWAEGYRFLDQELAQVVKEALNYSVRPEPVEGFSKASTGSARTV